MNEEEYINVQKEAENVRKNELEEYIKELEIYIAELDYSINANERYISNLIINKESYLQQWNNRISSCKNTFGENDFGCENEIYERNNNINEMENEYKEIEASIQSAKTDKFNWVTILQKAKERYNNLLLNPIVPELLDGIFRPKNSIFIKYHTPNRHTFSMYLSISLHELLHYYSYNSNDNLVKFLKEGFTDYFSMNTTSKYTNNKIIHYPEEVIIIEQIIKSIPEEELMKIYFLQDSTTLENNIDTLYPKGTYKQFINLGENLSYSDLKDITTRRNIMNNILSIIPTKESSGSAIKYKPVIKNLNTEEN